jgi:hypothetical protein
VERIAIDVSTLPAWFADLAKLAETGEVEIILVGPGGTRAKLVPAPPPDPTKREWVYGLHPGAAVMSPDFNDPPPDEFWLGDPATDPLQNLDAFCPSRPRDKQ